MKQLLFIVLFFTAISAFGQPAGIGTSASTKHDTVKVYVRQYLDTIKVRIYYEEKTYIRVANGFQIRYIQTDSSLPTGGTVYNSALYDDKWNLFKKPLFTITQVLEPTKK